MRPQENMTELLQEDKVQTKIKEKYSRTKVCYFIFIWTALTFYIPFSVAFLTTLIFYTFGLPYLEKKKKQILADLWKGIKAQEHFTKN